MLLSLDCDFSGSPWNLVQFARAAVALHWAAVAASLIANFMTFNPFPDHGDVKTWAVRCSCLFCCVSSSAVSSAESGRRRISEAGDGETVGTGDASLMYHPFPGEPHPVDSLAPDRSSAMSRGPSVGNGSADDHQRGPGGIASSSSRHQSEDRYVNQVLVIEPLHSLHESELI